MNSKDIQDILMKDLYVKGKDTFVTNFHCIGFEEADIVRVTKSNMVYEYEVKISRADFFKDFKKEYKHRKLQGIYPEKYDERWYLKNGGNSGRPNYFYYVCPDQLIKENEIPTYAGLIYITDNGVETIIKAPKLHSFKVTDKFIRKIANLLSTRTIFGCSYMHYKNKEIKWKTEKIGSQ